MSGEVPPATEDYEFTYPLVSGRSEEDLEGFGMNLVADYEESRRKPRASAHGGCQRDSKHELLSWLVHYGKHPEKREGLTDSTLESIHCELETVFRWPASPPWSASRSP
ncbi:MULTISPECIES: hypothetical protein [Haloferacaceae]|uniref:Uncharacterized protein n=1 Tax=Halorubrum glutamatedens TaxID=2707018 RepID=A0ABD5QQD6_9EURY|nr:hypothetical protein [Halobellus captivus]